MAGFAEGDRGTGPDELGAIHVVVQDVGSHVDEVGGEGAGRDGVVGVIDDEDRETSTLQLADGTPRREGDDRDIEPGRVHPGDEPIQVFLGAAVRAGRQHLDDPDPLAGRSLWLGRERRAPGRRPAWFRPGRVAHAHQAARRTRMRWTGSSTAPHAYL